MESWAPESADGIQDSVLRRQSPAQAGQRDRRACPVNRVVKMLFVKVLSLPPMTGSTSLLSPLAKICTRGIFGFLETAWAALATSSPVCLSVLVPGSVPVNAGAGRRQRAAPAGATRMNDVEAPYGLA